MSHAAPAPTPDRVTAFYRTAMLGLRLLEAREGRGQRFGETAHSRWKSFAGALEDRDRLDLLLRVGTVRAPLTFAPRSVFALEGLAEDEPFGPRWNGPPKGLATELLREASIPLAGGLRDALDLARKAWGLPAFAPGASLAASLERLSASTKLLVAGADAITGLTLAAQGRSDLDLAMQAVVVADAPAERQLWGLGLILLQAKGRGQLLTASESSAIRLRALGLSRVDVALISEDAMATARDTVRTTAADLSA